ncbi:hypothetical protein AAFF_G00230040 [Aldrovandia affinis]|uniref:Uncharacterized protein n=1 Tax=Aldrovandia affinis TaxID=143900 RepID=A0AAD7WUK6_9TELE|nr:hypothetical protein AAFF_G00230040 [Aldrovandia affinis]
MCRGDGCKPCGPVYLHCASHRGARGLGGEVPAGCGPEVSLRFCGAAEQPKNIQEKTPQAPRRGVCGHARPFLRSGSPCSETAAYAKPHDSPLPSETAQRQGKGERRPEFETNRTGKLEKRNGRPPITLSRFSPASGRAPARAPAPLPARPSSPSLGFPTNGRERLSSALHPTAALPS